MGKFSYSLFSNNIYFKSCFQLLKNQVIQQTNDSLEHLQFLPCFSRLRLLRGRALSFDREFKNIYSIFLYLNINLESPAFESEIGKLVKKFFAL